MIDPRVTVEKQTEVPTFGSDDKPTLNLRTRWKFGTRYGPYTDDAPKDGWTLDAFHDRIRRHVDQLATLPE